MTPTERRNTLLRLGGVARETENTISALLSLQREIQQIAIELQEETT